MTRSGRHLGRPRCHPSPRRQPVGCSVEVEALRAASQLLGVRARCSSAQRRSPGVLTVTQSPRCRKAASRASAGSGNVGLVIPCSARSIASSSEHVDPAAHHPRGRRGASRKPCTRSLPSRSTTANGLGSGVTVIVGRGRSRWCASIGDQVEVPSSSPFSANTGPVLAAQTSGEAQAARRARAAPAPPPERSPCRPGQLLLEQLYLPERHPTITRPTRARELGHLIGGEQVSRHGNERLRLAARSVAQPLGLAAGEHDGLHGAEA